MKKAEKTNLTNKVNEFINTLSLNATFKFSDKQDKVPSNANGICFHKEDGDLIVCKINNDVTLLAHEIAHSIQYQEVGESQCFSSEKGRLCKHHKEIQDKIYEELKINGLGKLWNTVFGVNVGWMKN